MQILKQVYDWLSIADPNKEFRPSFDEMKSWLDEEAEEFKDAQIAEDRREMLNAIIDQIWIVANMAYYGNLSLQDLEIESHKVNSSNSTKFCNYLRDAKESVLKYETGSHPNKIGKSIDTYYTEVGNYYVIRRTGDNKIMKSHLFKDTDKL
jgi:hypothetical protein